MPYKGRDVTARDRMKRYREKKGVTQEERDVTPFLLRPFGKEAQLAVKMSKKQAQKELTFEQLRVKYDYRATHS